jgi:hypothetical protein
MGSKRRHDTEDDYIHLQTSRKTERHFPRQARAVSQNGSDHYSNAGRHRSDHKSLPQPKRRSVRATNIAAELANLADYNEPPVKRSRKDAAPQTIDDKKPRTSRNRVDGSRASRSTNLNEKLHKQGARIVKSGGTTVRRKRSSPEEKVRAEAEKLGRWPGWVSEDDSVDDSGDEAQNVFPRSHSRRYPPKTPGTQNIPWNELPGEVRNLIYQYAMIDEDRKPLNVRHYPDGVPRRSIRGIAGPNNFAHSYWGFTQTCHELRSEFTPWLLEKRRVRTALETVNDYIHTFHRSNKDGEVTGWVEPICGGAPLPPDGVDVLGLLKLQENSPQFHLQLVSTAMSEALDALDMPTDPDHFDELDVIHDMAATFRNWSRSTTFSSLSLNGIRITSVTPDANIITNTEEDRDNAQHEILIKFVMCPDKAKDMPYEKRLESLNAIIFAAGLSNKTGVKLEAHMDTGVAIWKVRRVGVVDMRWKAQVNNEKVFRRLSEDAEFPGYTEEDLD